VSGRLKTRRKHAIPILATKGSDTNVPKKQNKIKTKKQTNKNNNNNNNINKPALYGNSSYPQKRIISRA
jgi:hypothetical protein